MVLWVYSDEVIQACASGVILNTYYNVIKKSMVLPYKKLLLRQKLVWLKSTEGINMVLRRKNRQIIAVAIKAVIIKTSQIYLKIPKIAIAVVH